MTNICVSSPCPGNIIMTDYLQNRSAAIFAKHWSEQSAYAALRYCRQNVSVFFSSLPPLPLALSVFILFTFLKEWVVLWFWNFVWASNLQKYKDSRGPALPTTQCYISADKSCPRVLKLCTWVLRGRRICELQTHVDPQHNEQKFV
jgi:hypothetical protein